MENTISITDQAEQVFIHHPHLKNRKIHCVKHENKIVLEGEVGSFFEKQLAQEALRDMDGLVVENRVTVAE